MIYLIFLILSLSSLYANQNDERDAQVKHQIDKFRDLVNTAAKNHADSIDIEKASDAAFKAFMQSLDKQSYYFTKEEFTKVNQQTQGSKLGLGISLIVDSNKVIIYNITENSQADSLGIEQGDEIISIDDVTLADKPPSIIDSLKQGENLSTAKLQIKKLNGDEVFFNIQRKSLLIKSVKAHFLVQSTDIAYIKLSRFTQHTFNELSNSLDYLEKQGMGKLILDLRQNTGGLLEQAYQTASLFLDSNKLVTKTQATNPKYSLNYQTKRKGEFSEIPIIIIIDDKTASSSEIFTAALQENDRATVIGINSYGKGSVQNTWNFKDSSAFRMTVAKYLTPLGRSLEKDYDSNKKQIPEEIKLNNSKETIDQIVKSLNRFGGKSKLDLKHTKKGKMIIDENGIFPDRYQKKDTLTLLTKIYKNKKYFHIFVYQYLTNIKDSLLSNYKDGTDFSINFNLPKSIVQDFANYSHKRGYFKKEMFIKDKTYIYYHIKARIAQALWGDNAYYYNELQPDSQIINAVKLFNTAPERKK